MPGSAFGSMGEGFLRLSFANSDENLREAVRRIAEHVERNIRDNKSKRNVREPYRLFGRAVVS